MNNPYAPSCLVEQQRFAPRRFRLVALSLAIFGAYLTLPELWSNLADSIRYRELLNPIGFLLGVGVFTATSYIAYAECRGRERSLRRAKLACTLLLLISLIVTVRFLTVFVPVITPAWARAHPGVVMGQVFCVCVWVYSVMAFTRRNRRLDESRATPQETAN